MQFPDITVLIVVINIVKTKKSAAKIESYCIILVQCNNNKYIIMVEVFGCDVTVENILLLVKL